MVWGIADGSNTVPRKYGRANRARFVEELSTLIKFPTVSAGARCNAHMVQCAAWLVAHLRSFGLDDARVICTRGQPVVLARWHRASGRPTVLIYGHYDVQPAEPLGEWHSPPFEPTIRGNDLYGRGASDDKGQLFCHVKAIECYLRTLRRIPVNVTLLIEGEEEIGSPSMPDLIDEHREALRADVAVISDTAMASPDQPAITYGLRGALSAEIEVRGPKSDLHSGTFGGAIHNPAQALCEIIAQLHDRYGRVAIPGFYDRVQLVGVDERRHLKRGGPSDAQVLWDAGSRIGWGEPEFTTYERTVIRPALSVNGITAGYQGVGPKGIIPAAARAKLNLRLVPNQIPNEVDRLLRQHVARLTPPGVQSIVRTTLSARPALTDVRHPAVAMAAASYQDAFGRPPVLIRSGGTIPIVSLLQDMLRCPTVLMGFAQTSDRKHAPNERFHLPSFFGGIIASIQFLSRASTLRAHVASPLLGRAAA